MHGFFLFPNRISFLLLFSSFSKKLESDSKSLTGLPNIPLLTAVLTHWPFLLANVSFKSL